MRQILSILAMVWAMVVCAQTATQNYVLSQTMLDDAIAEFAHEYSSLKRLSQI